MSPPAPEPRTNPSPTSGQHPDTDADTDADRSGGDGVGSDAPRWWVVVPMKASDGAKSRLRVPEPWRARLARAFIADTVRALLASPLVGGVLIVADPGADPDHLRALGASVLASDQTPAGLNPAVRAGLSALAASHPGAPLAVVLGDLPAIRPRSVTAVLERAAPGPFFVADADGSGTTVLADRGGVPQPRFGRGSAAAHRGAGAAEISALAPPDARRDVDTAADLASAVRLGVGIATAEVLAAMGS